MGYMLVVGTCFSCKRMITFNGDKVPSIRVNEQGQPDPSGEKEPVCKSCIERANPVRIKNGLPPIQIHPDAYEPEEVL